MRTLLLAIALIFLTEGPVNAAELSDAQIKKAIIAESLASYSGPCPCPYNSARNGSHCGARSAYSKPGGYDPICYDSDVTPAMIQNYKQKH